MTAEKLKTQTELMTLPFIDDCDTFYLGCGYIDSGGSMCGPDEIYTSYCGILRAYKNHYGTITQEFIGTDEGTVMGVIIYAKRDIKTDGAGGPWHGGCYESEKNLLSYQYLAIESVVNVDDANYGLMCVDEITTQSMNLPSGISLEMGDGILETFKTANGKMQRLTFAYSDGTQDVHMRFYENRSRKWFPWAKNN